MNERELLKVAKAAGFSALTISTNRHQLITFASLITKQYDAQVAALTGSMGMCMDELVKMNVLTEQDALEIIEKFFALSSKVHDAPS